MQDSSDPYIYLHAKNESDSEAGNGRGNISILLQTHRQWTKNRSVNDPPYLLPLRFEHDPKPESKS